MAGTSRSQVHAFLASMQSISKMSYLSSVYLYNCYMHVDATLRVRALLTMQQETVT
jgi:hypothetical protein